MNWREEFNKQFGFYQDKQVVYDFDYEDLQNFISKVRQEAIEEERQRLLKAVEEMEAQEKHVVARLAYGKVKELLNEKGEV